MSPHPNDVQHDFSVGFFLQCVPSEEMVYSRTQEQIMGTMVYFFPLLLTAHLHLYTETLGPNASGSSGCLLRDWVI